VGSKKKKTRVTKQSGLSNEKASKKGNEKTKARKRKDPNAPKKNMNAYMFFANTERSKTKLENP